MKWHIFGQGYKPEGGGVTRKNLERDARVTFLGFYISQFIFLGCSK